MSNIYTTHTHLPRERVRTQPRLGEHRSLWHPVNKVWLRKLNEITGVTLKEQITLKGFRSLQI